MKMVFLLGTLVSLSANSEVVRAAAEPFENLFAEASANGPCRVQRARSNGTTYYVPTDPRNKNARFHILGWGNGTGMLPSGYSKVLESIASHCILVAAANTQNAGSGKEIQNAVTSARSRYATKVFSSPRVCTSGHSQGGGGSFNAANLLKANCVIPVQADTVYTARVQKPLSANVEVIALWGSADGIAPADPSNLDNLDRNSSILSSVEISGENHFTITSSRGGNIGTLFRMAAKAQLSPDSRVSSRFRQAFWGPETQATVSTRFQQISDVDRDSGAVDAAP